MWWTTPCCRRRSTATGKETKMGAILSLIPIKDWIYGAIIAGLIAFGFYEVHHLKAEGAAHEVAALKESSDKLIAQETAHVALVAKTYAAQAAKTTETLDEQTQATAAAQSDAAQRLRNYDAYRRSHPDVARTGQPATDAAVSGAGEVVQRFSRMEQVALQLIGAAANSRDALTSFMTDRVVMTGKPYT